MPQTPEPATTDSEIFLEASERLRIAIEAMGENTKDAIEALEFEDGMQWPTDIANQRRIDRRPSLTINHTRTFVRRVVNNMRQQRPRIKVHATGDGAQIADAETMGGLIRHIENRSNASVAYDTAGESAVKIGWGYARVLTEYLDDDSFEQEIKIVPIRNPFTVYDDPSALMPTGQDRDWIIITEMMKRKEYKRKYPKAPNVEFRKGGAGDDGNLWESKEEIRLAEYFRIIRKTETLYKLVNGDGIFESDYTANGLPPGKALAFDSDAKPITRKSSRRIVQWYRMNGRDIVARATLPGHWIPVSRCLGNVLDLNGKVRYRGMVRDLMDVNRMYNYWATCETELVALAPRAPFIVAEGQVDGHPEWKDLNQKPYPFLVYKPVHSVPDDPMSPVLPPPVRQEPVPIPAGVMNARQGAEHDMMALAGMPHEPAQDKAGEVVSGAALRRRQALSDIGHFQYYDNQTQFIAHIGEILVDYIPHYYSTQRMQRIIGEDGVPQMITINEKAPSPEDPSVMAIKNDLSIGRYDIVMDTGPGYDTKREEGAEALIGLLGIPTLGEIVGKAGADLVVRAIDAPYMQELADRLAINHPDGMEKMLEGLPNQAKSAIKALQGQLQQAQQTIQQQAMEIKYKGTIEKGWMDVEREKVDKQTTEKLHATSINAQTKVFDTHVKSTTARDVAEIQAGAQLLNTHTEAEHNREAAKIELAAAAKAEKKGSE